LINKTCPNIFSAYTDILLLQECHVRRYEIVLTTQLRIARQHFSDWPSGAMQLFSARYLWDNSVFKLVSIDCVLRLVQPGKFVNYMKYIFFIKFFNLDKTASETYAISLKNICCWNHEQNMDLWMLFTFQKWPDFFCRLWMSTSPVVKWDI